jgi:hypothetical protein
MIKVITTNILGRRCSCLTFEMVAVLFADAIAEGRLRDIYMTQRPVAQALLLEKIGDIKLRWEEDVP